MSQNENIKKYLEAGHRITPIDALNLFGCFRLGARIADLKKRGMNIVTEIINDAKTGKRYAQYSLGKKEQRVCSECGKPMRSGYVVNGGLEYFCSDECLHKHYSEQEYLEIYDNGNGDSYWTEWDDDGGCVNSNTFAPAGGQA